jgi:glycosyltransferase involved in cell wall biosynthesis
MRALWVSNHSPFQTDFGGGQRSSLIYRTLREIADIDVLVLARGRLPGETLEELYGGGDGRLEVVNPTTRGQRFPWSLGHRFAPTPIDRLAYNLGRRSIDYAANPAVVRAVKRMGGGIGYDLLVGRHLKNSGQAGLLKSKRAIVDVDDNETELYRRIIDDPATSSIRKIVLSRRVRTLDSLLPRLLTDGPRLWVTKEEDLATPGFERARVLPNIPFALARGHGAPSVQPSWGSQTILFLGMLSYIYNIQGLDWFVSNVWPSVRMRCPRATFRIVGSRLRDEERARWSAVPGIQVTGFIDDVSVAYRDCRFVVAPLWSGGGTNIKILEGLLNGRTCVMTSSAYNGFARTLPQGKTVLVARDASQMIEHCVALLEKEDLCREMGREGATAVAEHYSFSKFRDVILETVDDVLRREQSTRSAGPICVGEPEPLMQ